VLGARVYSPALGAFLSLDPVLETGSPTQMGGYTYAGNNPVTFADPGGLTTTGPSGSHCSPGTAYLTQCGGNGTSPTGTSPGGSSGTETGDGSGGGGDQGQQHKPGCQYFFICHPHTFAATDDSETGQGNDRSWAMGCNTTFISFGLGTAAGCGDFAAASDGGESGSGQSSGGGGGSLFAAFLAALGLGGSGEAAAAIAEAEEEAQAAAEEAGTQEGSDASAAPQSPWAGKAVVSSDGKVVSVELGSGSEVGPGSTLPAPEGSDLLRGEPSTVSGIIAENQGDLSDTIVTYTGSLHYDTGGFVPAVTDHVSGAVLSGALVVSAIIEKLASRL
jgi:hypothetical protein